MLIDGRDPKKMKNWRACKELGVMFQPIPKGALEFKHAEILVMGKAKGTCP